ncbi:hypothetical protein A1O1_06192 [Capronia coronata CBS 617.96]|uniref:Mannan endo-1,6-alpha-mannosidase n=1 Tax=Capronia coronata CBS 617.96 TaxID=1182541 RepID=W9Y019_9EURO|nr:uncharacterized protein A1O1_06192 [Capronia coronata CBS 617.96]EXJ85823.1 hypothetical protein A1O1_06192 [Capronia coronata CBS 617.96]
MSLSLGAEALINTTQTAIDVFLASKQANGQISGLGYWQVANGYTAIALHDSWSQTTGNAEILHDLLVEVEANQTDCINDFNDDSSWWGIFLLEMYDLTQDTNHLSVAQNIWAHVHDYVIPPGQYVINGTDMEGGVKWSNKNNETQVNAITTGLFTELSARLALVQQDPARRREMLTDAIFGFFWILRCRYLSAQYVVLDHIDLQTGQCFDWTFTYNTGQAIAAAVAIYDAMKQTQTQPANSPGAGTYLDLACNMARAAMTRSTWVDADGTLTERGAYPGTGPNSKQASENDDAVGFKGVLLRSLAKLYKILSRDRVYPDLQTQLAGFVQWQFQSLQQRATNGRGQFGPWWAGPMDLPTSHSQLAALDVMAAIHAIQ